MRKTFTLLIALMAFSLTASAANIEWNTAAVQSINVYCNGENYYGPQSQAVNGISVTANTPNSGSNSDYSSFSYNTYSEPYFSSISVGGDGTLTFSSVGNITSIVIHTDENGSGQDAGAWTWSNEQHTLTWTGDAASVVLADNAYVSNITSIEFAVSVPSSLSWNQATVQSINVYCNGENYYGPQSQVVNGISVTANTPNSGSNSDYSSFSYNTYSEPYFSSISVGGDGTLTFSSVNMTSIVIHTDENGSGQNAGAWTWSNEQHTLTWTGDAASVVLADNAYVSNITSIDFTFASDDPEPTPEPVISTVIWEGTDLTSVDVYQDRGMGEPQSQIINGSVNITVTAAAPGSGDYSQFKTYSGNSTNISVDANGTLTFTPASGKLTGIVIECEYAGNTETLVEGSGWRYENDQLIWSSEEGASSVTLACDGSASGCWFSNVSSVKFTIVTEEEPTPDPEPVGTTITWNQATVNEISLECSSLDDTDSMEEDIDGITASLTRTFAEGSACKFKGREVWICGNGELTFSSSDGNISSIVITYDFISYDPTSLPAGWTHDAEAMTFTWNGTPSNVVTISGNIDFKPTSIVFTVVPATPEPTETATIHFAEIYHYEITEFTHTDDDCGHRNGLSTPSFNVWLKDENGQDITDVMPLTVTSSDENVVTVSLGDYYGPTDPDRLISCQPTGYGTATITATFAGNETYFPTQASFTYHFYRNETPMAACALVDKNGDPVTSIVATEGDLIDAPHLARVDGEDLCYTYLAMATTTNRSRWRRNPSTNHWDYFYPKQVGLDTIVFTYYRESSFDSRETEDYKYWDQGVEVRIPVVIMPYITPMISDAETVMNLNPEGNASMSFGKTENDTYNSAEGQLEIKSIVTAANLKLALDSMARGTKDWNDLLPGATTFNVNPGKGKIKIECKTVAGYELKVLVANQGTATISQVDMDVAEISYNVNQVTTVLVYLAATGGSPAPQRRAPQAKLDEPNAIIKSITVSPQFDIEAKQDPDNAGLHYSTFFNSTQKYALPNNGTKAFVAKIDGTDMIMTEIAKNDEIIPANTAVILQSPTGSFSLTPSDGSAVTFDSNKNQLQGVDEATAALPNCYVLSGHSTAGDVTGVGFYQFSGTIPAHKAYITVSGSAPAPKRLRFVFNGENAATGIGNASETLKSEKRIENGQLVIIKNGVRYNAQGQIVK